MELGLDEALVKDAEKMYADKLGAGKLVNGAVSTQRNPIIRKGQIACFMGLCVEVKPESHLLGVHVVWSKRVYLHGHWPRGLDLLKA